jgi:hypothetical protein
MDFAKKHHSEKHCLPFPLRYDVDIIYGKNGNDPWEEWKRRAAFQVLDAFPNRACTHKQSMAAFGGKAEGEGAGISPFDP